MKTRIEDSIDGTISLAGIRCGLVGASEDNSALSSGETGASRVGGSQGREGLEGKVGAIGKASDKLGSKGEDGVEVQGGVKGTSEWLVTNPSTDVRGMASLNGQDGASGRHVSLVCDGRGRAQVGRNTNTLEDGREAEE